MDKNLLVSVVIPLYNNEKYIQRAVLSVLAQTVQDYELIIVDDGSTDSSYQQVVGIQDARIRVIRQENQGASVARNTGVEQASSPLITFLDSDDEWKPVFLEKMFPVISQYPECVLYGAGYETYLPDGTILSTNHLFPVEWSGIIPNYIKIMATYPFCTNTVVVRKKTLSEIGGFPVGVKFGQDVATWLRCSLVGRIAYLNQPLAIYHREVPDSSSQRFDRRKEPYPVILLKELLRDQAIPLESRPYALDYIARSSLKTSKARFRAGEPIRALFPLWNCIQSRVYWKKIVPLLRTEFLPSMKKALLG